MNLPIYVFNQPTIGGLASLVASIITMFGILWLGIIVFTFILKTLVLPLDYFSRASMRKMSVKMERMRPELEKLQEQYANDKNMYNQKMMALYKKEKINMFGSCLPTIISLVLFIIVLNAFQTYSSYQNNLNYYDMSLAFNSVAYEGIEKDDNFITTDADGKLIIKDVEMFVSRGTNDVTTVGNILAEYTKNELGVYTRVRYSSTNSYIYLVKNMSFIDGTYVFDATGNYYARNEGLVTRALAKEKNNQLLNSDGLTFEQYCTQKGVVATDIQAGYDFLLNVQQTEAKLKYEEEKQSFLWIRNIWQPDSALQKEIPSTWSSNEEYKQSYETITHLLKGEKEAVNGYFILVIITALSSWLMQFIMTKGQKAQMELQSVDGTAKSTQKAMLYIMPILMGVFSLFYTAAFSIYIIVSNVYSLGSTLVINKIVDIKIKKEDKKKGENNKVLRSKPQKAKVRPTVENKTEEPKKAKKQKNKIPQNDFLSSNEPEKEIKAEQTLTVEERKELDKKRKQSTSKKKQQQKKKNNK